MYYEKEFFTPYDFDAIGFGWRVYVRG